jgi:hypothetical protein
VVPPAHQVRQLHDGLPCATTTLPSAASRKPRPPLRKELPQQLPHGVRVFSKVGLECLNAVRHLFAKLVVRLLVIWRTV